MISRWCVRDNRQTHFLILLMILHVWFDTYLAGYGNIIRLYMMFFFAATMESIVVVHLRVLNLLDFVVGSGVRFH